jgi:hypothetical protein
VPDGQVRTPDRRGQPGPAGQLAGAAEPGDVTDLGHHDQRGELPDAEQRPQYLDPRVGLGAGVQLAVDPVGQRRQAAGDRQAVGDDLPRRRRQTGARPASRGPARPGSWRTGHSRGRRRPRGSGCAAGCRAGPGRSGAAAARGAAGPPSARAAPRAAGPRAAAAPGSRRRPLSFFTPRGGDRLAPQRVHQVRVEAVVLQQIGQPAPAERGPGRHRRPRGQVPDQAQERLGAVHHVLVELHLAGPR